MGGLHAQLMDFVDEIDGVLRRIDTAAKGADKELLESLPVFQEYIMLAGLSYGSTSHQLHLVYTSCN